MRLIAMQPQGAGVGEALEADLALGQAEATAEVLVVFAPRGLREVERAGGAFEEHLVAVRVDGVYLFYMLLQHLHGWLLLNNNTLQRICSIIMYFNNIVLCVELLST